MVSTGTRYYTFPFLISWNVSPPESLTVGLFRWGYKPQSSHHAWKLSHAQEYLSFEPSHAEAINCQLEQMACLSSAPWVWWPSQEDSRPIGSSDHIHSKRVWPSAPDVANCNHNSWCHLPLSRSAVQTFSMPVTRFLVFSIVALVTMLLFIAQLVSLPSVLFCPLWWRVPTVWTSSDVIIKWICLEVHRFNPYGHRRIDRAMNAFAWPLHCKITTSKDIFHIVVVSFSLALTSSFAVSITEETMSSLNIPRLV